MKDEAISTLTTEQATHRAETRNDAAVDLALRPVPTWKRTLDLTGAVAGLVLLAPLFLVVTLIIKCGSRGPVFFRQHRAGYQGKSFRIFKFRSLKVDVDSTCHRRYVSDLARGDAMLTKLNNERDYIFLGRFLRKSCIDELPQLINVLRGEMSLVGPRPDVMPFEEYPDWQRARFQVLPGMTGLWQVSGKNRTTFEQMIELDIKYATSLGLSYDVKILALTVPTILKQLAESTT